MVLMSKQPKRVVWKYQLILTSEVQTVDIPVKCRNLCVKWLNGPTMWALVEPDEGRTLKSFKVYGTGEMLDRRYHHTYIGTCFQKTTDITYVWHIFQVTKLGSVENG